MRQNPSFALADENEIRRVIEANPWATIMSAGDDGLVASHYAVLLDDACDDLTVVGHVGRPDDLIHGMGHREMLVVFQGPHGYVSPGCTAMSLRCRPGTTPRCTWPACRDPDR